ncbi:MAG: hypothetical protein A2X94_07470 [Bdellovibrionales bacterium GWB1_55_8]|nr:MAG: hypothetical protein A2X94_07470 [Bdellovibrionales bacterium GWB1_55_8]
MGPDRILYEDDDLIIVNKPAKLPTQPTLDESRDNLFAAVKRFLAQRDKVAQPYVGLHHRLDRDTSGVVLFTKSSRANVGIANAFSSHQAVKVYLALSERAPGRPMPLQWKVQNHLGRAKVSGKKARFTAVHSGGDFAHTDFKLLEEFPGAFLVEARPKTGRTHQIRVHLAEAGYPILGDLHYGAKAGRSKRIMLHAASLTLPHPIHQTEISIHSPLPEDFQECLQASRT